MSVPLCGWSFNSQMGSISHMSHYTFDKTVYVKEKKNDWPFLPVGYFYSMGCWMHWPIHTSRARFGTVTFDFI
jgi:hypothetical protein